MAHAVSRHRLMAKIISWLIMLFVLSNAAHLSSWTSGVWMGNHARHEIRPGLL